MYTVFTSELQIVNFINIEKPHKSLDVTFQLSVVFFAKRDMFISITNYFLENRHFSTVCLVPST